MTDKEIETFVHWLQSLTAKKFYGSDVEDLIFEHKNKALSQHDVMACVCNEEDKHGWTEIKCCNECGKPIEDFWCKH